jgi:Protein of unknown function DUF115.
VRKFSGEYKQEIKEMEKDYSVMKYIIWGAGIRGERILKHIGKRKVEAFIDMDQKKIGKEYLGTQVISFDEYMIKYRKLYIIISCLEEQEVINLLEAKEIHKYFLMTECPGEWQENNIRTLLKEHICGMLNEEKGYAIYGVTLYSFILNDWVEECTGKRAVMLLDNEPEEFQKMITTDFSNETFVNVENIDAYQVDQILVACENGFDAIKKDINSKYNINNVYDCSSEINGYFNPQIEEFKNLHREERCFIVATGPSLQIEDLEILKRNKEICFGMNGILRAFKRTEWRPYYYVADDQNVYYEYGDLIETMEVDHIFLGDTDKEFWLKPHRENVMKYHCAMEKSKARLPKFSENIARKCYGGATVTYSCIQLAAYMGFKEIYLLGVDFTYGKDSNNKKYPHFYNEEKLTSIGSNERVYLAYLSAKKYADSHGITIYNATKGGKLDVFKRIDFEQLFE